MVNITNDKTQHQHGRPLNVPKANTGIYKEHQYSCIMNITYKKVHVNKLYEIWAIAMKSRLCLWNSNQMGSNTTWFIPLYNVYNTSAKEHKFEDTMISQPYNEYVYLKIKNNYVAYM